MSLTQLSADFQSLPPLPTSKLDPSGTDSQMGGFVYILGPFGSLQYTLLWGWGCLLPLPLLQVFSVRGFEALFPHAGTLGCTVCLTPQLFLQVYPHANVGPPIPPATTAAALPWVLSTPAPHLYPSYQSRCFFFNSLAVRLPYSSIFWQFSLAFVFKLVVTLLLVVRGGETYLPMPPSWPELLNLLFPALNSLC